MNDPRDHGGFLLQIDKSVLQQMARDSFSPNMR